MKLSKIMNQEIFASACFKEAADGEFNGIVHYLKIKNEKEGYRTRSKHYKSIEIDQYGTCAPIRDRNMETIGMTYYKNKDKEGPYINVYNKEKE